MIIEFFGPPASGKTTLSAALAARLRSGGFDVGLRLSSRPGEEMLAQVSSKFGIASTPIGATARRLLRPACELLVAAVRAHDDAKDSRCTDVLAHALAHGHTLRFLRMKQYLIRLENAWSRAENSADIWIFDQAYVQVIATILLHQPHLSDRELLAMLDLAPKSNLVVFVNTPIEEIQTRLGRRQRIIGYLGRLFEEDHGDVAMQAQAAARVDESLNLSGRRVVTVNSSDDEPLDIQIGAAQHAIRTMSFACEKASGRPASAMDRSDAQA